MSVFMFWCLVLCKVICIGLTLGFLVGAIKMFRGKPRRINAGMTVLGTSLLMLSGALWFWQQLDEHYKDMPPALPSELMVCLFGGGLVIVTVFFFRGIIHDNRRQVTRENNARAKRGHVHD